MLEGVKPDLSVVMTITLRAGQTQLEFIAHGELVQSRQASVCHSYGDTVVRRRAANRLVSAIHLRLAISFSMAPGTSVFE